MALKKPSYGINKKTYSGFLRKVKTQLKTTQNSNLGMKKANLVHHDSKRKFKFTLIDNEFQKKSYAELSPRFKLSDSSALIKTWTNLDFAIDDRIETLVGINGLISGEVIEKVVSRGYNGKPKLKEYIILIDG